VSGEASVEPTGAISAADQGTRSRNVRWALIATSFALIGVYLGIQYLSVRAAVFAVQKQERHIEVTGVQVHRLYFSNWSLHIEWMCEAEGSAGLVITQTSCLGLGVTSKIVLEM